MKYCVVTCIFNNYEPVREPCIPDDNCDYFLFTDNRKLMSKYWKVIYLEDFDNDSLDGRGKTHKLKYTFYKYIDLSQYDYIVQLDSSLKILRPITPIVEYISRNNYDISVAPHPVRKNVLDEYIVWIQKRHLNAEYFRKFLILTPDFDYSKEGLVECTVKIYKNCQKVLNFIDDVYNILSHNNAFSDQDQGYFTYILYKNLDNLRINYHHATLYHYSKYMALCDHNTEEYLHEDIVQYEYNTDKLNFLGRDITITDNTLYDPYFYALDISPKKQEKNEK